MSDNLERLANETADIVAGDERLALIILGFSLILSGTFKLLGIRKDDEHPEKGLDWEERKEHERIRRAEQASTNIEAIKRECWEAWERYKGEILSEKATEEPAQDVQGAEDQDAPRWRVYDAGDIRSGQNYDPVVQEKQDLIGIWRRDQEEGRASNRLRP